MMAPLMPRSSQIARRKSEHLELALNPEAQSGAPGWADISLLHDSLPELDFEDLDLSCELFGHVVEAPLVVASMTGGHPDATAINARLAQAAERHSLAIGVGSQRAALEEPDLADTYEVVRRHAPTAFVLANIGVSQLKPAPSRAVDPTELADRAIEMINADALAIHLNVLEESVQTEGDRGARGWEEAIRIASAAVKRPVVVKETGGGMSRSTALRLRELGVDGLDVGGLGGTNFARIEGQRAERQGDARGVRLGELLGEWGIPTAVSLVGARAAGLPLIATGGVRTGLDAAKAFALGARAVGVGKPLLAAALEGDEALDEWIAGFLDELRTVLLLSGSRRPAELAQRPLVVADPTRAWIDALGYERASRPDTEAGPDGG